LIYSGKREKVKGCSQMMLLGKKMSFMSGYAIFDVIYREIRGVNSYIFFGATWFR
jgi:hypothetical protein